MPLLTNQLGKRGLMHTPRSERELPAIGATVYLPPLCWEREKGESSPVFPKRNIIYLGAWDLANSEASKPQTSPFPSVLFHKATCTLAEIPVSTQARTKLVCLAQWGIAGLHGTSSRMERDNENAQLKTKLVLKNGHVPHQLFTTLKPSLKDILVPFFHRSQQGCSSRNTL